MTQDPMAEKYYGISSYVYCVDNPVCIVDPEGFDIYRYDDESGEMTLVEENDDEYDQVGTFEYNRKTGAYTLKTRKDGTARTRIDQIEKGILNPKGMNFFKDNYISLQGDSRPSIPGVQKFLLDFSNMVDREVGGYYISGKGQEAIQYITIGGIRNNTADKAIPGNPYRALADLPGFKIDNYDVLLNYHTHLSRFSDYDRLHPSSLGPDGGDIGFKNRQSAKSPTMKFLIITNPTPFYY